MMAALEMARDALAQIAGISSCRIGLEANISPSDYPIIRIVPNRIVPGVPGAGRVYGDNKYENRTAGCTIYFGMPVADSEGLEEVYRSMLGMETEIIAVLKDISAKYIETLMDEDRLPTYKIGAVRCELTAVG